MKLCSFSGKWLQQLILLSSLGCSFTADGATANTWSYHQETDRSSNETYSFAQSPNPHLDLYDNIKLVVFCKESKLQVVIDADDLIASQNRPFDVEYQIDKNAPQSLTMKTFPDSKRKGYTEEKAKQLIDDLLAGQTSIFIRVKTMIRTVLSVSIPLNDAVKPISQVYQDCKVALPDTTTMSTQDYSLADFQEAFNQLSKEQQQQVLNQIKKILMELP
jgi:hypothetical protein